MLFFQFGTSYPLYRYEIAHITIQKENGKRKHSFWTRRLGKRGNWFTSFFFAFLFLGRVGNQG